MRPPCDPAFCGLSSARKQPVKMSRAQVRCQCSKFSANGAAPLPSLLPLHPHVSRLKVPFPSLIGYRGSATPGLPMMFPFTRPGLLQLRILSSFACMYVLYTFAHLQFGS